MPNNHVALLLDISVIICSVSTHGKAMGSWACCGLAVNGSSRETPMWTSVGAFYSDTAHLGTGLDVFTEGEFV